MSNVTPTPESAPTPLNTAIPDLHVDEQGDATADELAPLLPSDSASLPSRASKALYALTELAVIFAECALLF